MAVAVFFIVSFDSFLFTNMTTVEQNGLSGRDLRIKLFDLMKSKGIVDNVKVDLIDIFNSILFEISLVSFTWSINS
jgi:hypothetical protein